MKLVLPLPPNIANGRMHWRTKHKAKHEYWASLYVRSLNRSFPPRPINTPNKVSVTATLYVHSLMDVGNLMARLKWLEDWLVSAGYAKDDSPKHWEYTGIPSQVIDRKNPRVELVIEELP